MQFGLFPFFSLQQPNRISKTSSIHPNNNFFTGTGTADITCNVDFLPVIEAGAECDLTPITLALQSDLNAVMPDLGTEPISIDYSEASKGFFALVQQKKGTKAQFCIPAHSFLDHQTNRARFYSQVLDNFLDHMEKADEQEFKTFFNGMEKKKFSFIEMVIEEFKQRQL